MATAHVPGVSVGTANTVHYTASGILSITAYPKGYDDYGQQPIPADEKTTMKSIPDEVNLLNAAGIAEKNRLRALQEADRHDALSQTLRNLAHDHRVKREEEQKRQHLQDYVAEEIFGYMYQHLSPRGQKAVDEIIKLRAEVDKKGTK